MKLSFCVACGVSDLVKLEHHHLIPRSKGGSDEDSNLITLCHACHGRAHGFERQNIAALTKAALAAAKARGVKLGGDPKNLEGVRALGTVASAKVRGAKANMRAQDVAPIIRELQSAGASLRRIADELTARGIPTAQGGETWTATGVKRVVERAAA
jgi:hypothetical protein